MQINEQVALGRAFDSSRAGLNAAQARLNRTADSVAALNVEDELGSGAPVRPPADMARDMVELSRAGVEAQVNTASFRVASDVFDELANLGRRIDVRV
jgi:hypothetical protein